MSAALALELEVEELDPAALLELAAANQRELRRLEVLQLRLAYQWAVTHPATAESGVETWGGAVLPDVLTTQESLGGDGTPAVAAFTPEAFALAIGTSPISGGQLIGDALDLHHRLPVLWRRVRRLEVPVWQARRVAQQTHALPREGARWVDQQLGLRSDGRCGPIITDRLVALALARFDPEEHERREDAAHAASEVTITHGHTTGYAATSEVTATGDTVTLKTFHDLLCAIAHQLHLDGDTDPLGVRKIKAIALVTATITTLATGPTGPTAPDLGPLLATAARKATAKLKVYVRVEAEDLDLDATDGSAFAVGQVERLGAATMAKLRQWVGHSQVVFQPVLNLARRDAVDSHDPPAWMTELVELRDGHCVFPRCTVPATACDKDHEIAYVPIEEGGPPGQTRPDNLACLCRRHHRAKTAKVWRYSRTPEGHYLWHGPHGATYVVTSEGTTKA